MLQCHAFRGVATTYQHGRGVAATKNRRAPRRVTKTHSDAFDCILKLDFFSTIKKFGSNAAPFVARFNPSPWVAMPRQRGSADAVARHHRGRRVESER